MSDYEFRNAGRWEEEKRTPVRKQKNKSGPKKKKKSTAGSVTGSAPASVAGSVRGSRPASPARSVNSNNDRARPASRAQSTKSSGQFPSSSSEPDAVSTAASDYEPSSPWGDGPRHHEQYDSDFQAVDYSDGYETDQRDPDAAYGYAAFSAPNFYYNEDPAMEMEAYESPDGLRRENEGVRLERLGYTANAFFTISAGRSLKFDEMFFGPNNNVNLRHIAAKTNTYIDIPDGQDEPKLPIWGKPDQVSIAIRELMLLTEHIQRMMDLSKRRRGGKWEKIKAAPSDRKQRYLEQQARERIKRRELRHRPPKKHFEFNAVGAFSWPKDTNPQDYLGPSFERLDDVRYDCDAYITADRVNEGYMFQALGEDQGKVQKAIDRLYGTYCEVAAKNREPINKYLVHPPSMDVQNISVDLITERDLKDRQTGSAPGRRGVRALLVGDSPSWDFLEEWKSRREKLERANHAYIKKVAEQGLKDVLYYNGHVSLKIHFGTLVFFGYKNPPPGEYFSLEEFCSMVRDPIGMTVGEVIRYIGEDYIAKALINECLARKDLFHPVDSGYSKFAENPYSDVVDEHDEFTDSHLSTPEPIIEATFKLIIYDINNRAHDIRLEVQFERIPGRHPGDMANEGGDLYKVGMRRWLYLRSNATNIRTPRQRRKGPFDIRVLDLESDLAWQFELNTYQFCSDADTYPIFREFLKKIRVEDIPDESDPIGPPTSGRADRRKRVQRISYVNLPGIVVENIVQKTKHQFWITKTSYLFEITRYECFFTEEVDKLYPPGVQISWKGLETGHDIRWGATLKNAEWDANLAKQTSLKVGCPGNWEPEIDYFFKSSGIGGFDHPAWARDGNVFENPDPWGGDGWKELMTRTDEITRFIAGVRRAHLAFSEPGYAGPEEFDE